MRTDFALSSFMKVTTPLGADKLLLVDMEASEGISELFKLTLHMQSKDNALVAANIIGKSVTVTLTVTDGPTRHFNGIASRFVQTGVNNGLSYYSADVVPTTWLLTLARDRAIYQTKTVPEIVKAVLTAAGVTVSDKLTGTYTALDYCVQYDETGFDFISRLMEDNGIFYWFTFASGSHTMVLADASSAHLACTGSDAVRFFPESSPLRMIDTIATLEVENRLVTKTHVVDDYDPLNPATALLGTSAGSAGDGEVYDWPGKYATAAKGTALAKLRLEASQIDSKVMRGDGYVYGFAAGTKFTLSGHFLAALNASHVLRRVHHTARGGVYLNHFEAFAATVPFRAPRVAPRPRGAGSQTAVVVGPSGEEIWSDKNGRIKVQFHWDRLGKKDDTCSCWVRVSQAAAGAGFGSLFLPRVGQEVVISCIDGDPDQPLVTGCVYNGTHATPVTLPANQTQTVIRTKSSKQGTAGNEIRLEDKKDSEEFYLHAQKDMKIEIENDLSTTLTAGAEIHTIEKGDRTVAVKTGKETHSVKGVRALTITGNETHTNEADFTHEVTGKYTLKVTGDLLFDVTGSISFKSAKDVAVKAGTTVDNEAGTALTNKAGTALTNKAGTALTNEAGTALTNKAGTALTNKAGTGLTNEAGTTLDNKGLMINSKASATQTVDGGGMLTVKGGLVKIN